MRGGWPSRPKRQAEHEGNSRTRESAEKTINIPAGCARLRLLSATKGISSNFAAAPELSTPV